MGEVVVESNVEGDKQVVRRGPRQDFCSLTLREFLAIKLKNKKVVDDIYEYFNSLPSSKESLRYAKQLARIRAKIKESESGNNTTPGGDESYDRAWRPRPRRHSKRWLAKAIIRNLTWLLRLPESMRAECPDICEPCRDLSRHHGQKCESLCDSLTHSSCEDEDARSHQDPKDYNHRDEDEDEEEDEIRDPQCIEYSQEPCPEDRCGPILQMRHYDYKRYLTRFLYSFPSFKQGAIGLDVWFVDNFMQMVTYLPPEPGLKKLEQLDKLEARVLRRLAPLDYEPCMFKRNLKTILGHLLDRIGRAQRGCPPCPLAPKCKCETPD